jgi:hypothetical protein
MAYRRESAASLALAPEQQAEVAALIEAADLDASEFAWAVQPNSYLAAGSFGDGSFHLAFRYNEMVPCSRRPLPVRSRALAWTRGVRTRIRASLRPCFSRSRRDALLPRLDLRTQVGWLPGACFHPGRPCEARVPQRPFLHEPLRAGPWLETWER